MMPYVKWNSDMKLIAFIITQMMPYTQSCILHQHHKNVVIAKLSYYNIRCAFIKYRRGLTSKVIAWCLDVTGSVSGVDGTEESSWRPVDDDTTGADLVSSDVVPDDRTNGAGLDSRDHVTDETVVVAATPSEANMNDSVPIQTATRVQIGHWAMSPSGNNSMLIIQLSTLWPCKTWTPENRQYLTLPLMLINVGHFFNEFLRNAQNLQ